jgi:predicted DNA-binding antitoxin AbrB/MazE fold protein
MTKVVEALFENGVFKPLIDNGLKEQHRYRLIVLESAPKHWADDLVLDPELAAEIERRTTILPDGRTIIRLEELFPADLSNVPEGEDPVVDALSDLRRARES